MSDMSNDIKIPLAFAAKDVFGNKINLADVKDDYILLVFLRYSGCAWCNLAVHRLSLEYARLRELNCQIITFVQSERNGVIENIYDRHELTPQFPIIADHAMEIYKKYRVNPSVIGAIRSLSKTPYWLQSVKKYGYKQKKVDGNLFIVPAWFLINNRTGKIVKSERGISFYETESFITIYDSLTFKD